MGSAEIGDPIFNEKLLTLSQATNIDGRFEGHCIVYDDYSTRTVQHLANQIIRFF